jgi:hypothetical protein
MLVNKDAPVKLSQSPFLELIVTLFVAAVALQIFLAFLNKWGAWQMYRGGYDAHLALAGDSSCEGHHESRTFRAWRWINKQSWIDFSVDLASLVAFSLGTWLALSALLAVPQAT